MIAATMEIVRQASENRATRVPRACLLAGGILFALAVAGQAQQRRVAPPSATASAKDEFAETIFTVLAQHCSAYHNANNPRNRINFLKASTGQDIQSNRGLWRNVAAQLRNRTMPPVDSKIREEERLRVSTWIDGRLRQTACAIGDYAGAVALRRLNRREYRNTIRDLLGVDYNVPGLFPNDGSGGSGFDTNGETLFIPPLLMERYLEAAQQILDRAIITPDLVKTFAAAELLPVDSSSTAGSRELVAGAPVAVRIRNAALQPVFVHAPSHGNRGEILRRQHRNVAGTGLIEARDEVS